MVTLLQVKFDPKESISESMFQGHRAVFLEESVLRINGAMSKVILHNEKNTNFMSCRAAHCASARK